MLCFPVEHYEHYVIPNAYDANFARLQTSLPTMENAATCEYLFRGSGTERGGGNASLGIMYCVECLVAPAFDVCRIVDISEAHISDDGVVETTLDILCTPSDLPYLFR